MTAAAPLLSETRRLVARLPRLSEFLGATLEGLPEIALEPQMLPSVSQMLDWRPDPSVLTAPIVKAIFQVAHHLCWRQSYSEAQVGAHHLANYGWFNIVSPEGPYLSDTLRISVGFWNKGLSYPAHRHAPEEIYCVLAGHARFETEGRAPVEAQAGTLIHHPANILHGIEMPTAPLLAMAFWRGEALCAPSRIGRAAEAS